ncbi:MAG: hypothetical protein PHH69_03740, partial [Candidatus Omnitrophica bacterium]|nr:hypothetical protein [Candidatus Omnitrophota bacterium]
MHIAWNEVIVGVIAFYFLAKRWLFKAEKILGPLVADVEQRAKDGKIDKEDRKQVMLNAVSEAEKDGRIKLTLLQRTFLGFVINWLA